MEQKVASTIFHQLQLGRFPLSCFLKNQRKMPSGFSCLLLVIASIPSFQHYWFEHMIWNGALLQSFGPLPRPLVTSLSILFPEMVGSLCGTLCNVREPLCFGGIPFHLKVGKDKARLSPWGNTAHHKSSPPPDSTLVHRRWKVQVTEIIINLFRSDRELRFASEDGHSVENRQFRIISEHLRCSVDGILESDEKADALQQLAKQARHRTDELMSKLDTLGLSSRGIAPSLWVAWNCYRQKGWSEKWFRTSHKATWWDQPSCSSSVRFPYKRYSRRYFPEDWRHPSEDRGHIWEDGRNARQPGFP